MTGVILCGGYSLRAGTDKSMRWIGGRPAYQYLFDMLSQEMDDVIISCRSDQKEQYGAFPTVVDHWKAIGPLAGILSVMRARPNTDLMIIACDMTLVEKADIRLLINNFTMNTSGVFFQNEKSRIIEPLFGIYTFMMFDAMLSATNVGNYSLQKLIPNIPNITLLPIHEGKYLSVNY